MSTAIAAPSSQSAARQSPAPNGQSAPADAATQPIAVSS